MLFRYNKLIRDKIVNKLSRLGKRFVVHTAVSDDEYWMKLKEKLQEEINEFGIKEDLESLCDVYEILDAIVAFKKFDRKELMAIKENKSIEFGNFTERRVLDESEEELGKTKTQ